MELVESSDLSITFDSQSRCDGSASVTLSNSQAIAGCYGPLESRTSNIATEGQLEVAFKAHGATVQQDVSTSILIKESLEGCIKQIPRTVITLSVRLVADEGSGFAASMLVAVAALIHAGISLTKLPIGVECFLLPSGEIRFVSTNEVKQASKAHALFVFCNNDEGPTSLILNGKCSKKDLNLLIEIARTRATSLRQHLEHSVKQFVEADDDLCMRE